jgi:Dynein heavy chain AAA lid domain
MTICKILEGILPKESVRGAPPPDKKLLEHHFVFACIWAFGGCMLVDKVRVAPPHNVHVHAEYPCLSWPRYHECHHAPRPP